MIEEIDIFLQNLLTINTKGISNAEFGNGKFSFEYGGGKFILIKSISPNLKIGCLNLFHETPFSGSKHLIEVDNFEIIIAKNSYTVAYKIKNHFDLTVNDFRRKVDEEGYETIDLDYLHHTFSEQLISKLKKDNFKIYLK